MSLKDELKVQIRKATLAKDTFTNSILKVILGEIELAESRKGSITEQESQKIVSKLVESNKETLAVMKTTDARYQVLVDENTLMETLIPKSLNKAEVMEIIKSDKELYNTILSSNHAGKSIGAAMKLFKMNGSIVNGKDVSACVMKIMMLAK